MPTIEVFVEPTVLVWARESIGESIERAAKRLRTTPETVKEFESGEKKPRLAQLEKLANLYKRPLAVFLLSEPPKEPPLPDDFRTLPEGEREPFSPDTRLAIRRARRLQNLAAELARELDREIEPQIGRASLPERYEDLTSSAEDLASKTRKELGVEIQTQFEWKNNRKALNQWRHLIERRGVLLFQMRMPFKETRGFSLTEGELPAIILNLDDSINGRIFSLFHEYAHLMIDHGGICDMKHTNHQRIEVFCNHFAGAFLVPRADLLSYPLVRTKQKKIEWPEEDLQELSLVFKVSKEVILRRFLILGLTTEDFYQDKREEWYEKWEEGKKKEGGRRNMARECLRDKGVPFVSLVLEAYESERITLSDVADYLGTRLQYLSQIEELARASI
ncbi:hypothetical protein ES703_17031 [subsurface metagenome]|nr:ImmA/IrrE family metallo-endopeptidase [bacterium]